MPAARDVVWEAVAGYAPELQREAAPWGAVVRWVLGTEPGTGFAVVEVDRPRRIALAGRHRFARYRLELELDVVDDARTRLTARSFADWRGRRGRLYGFLVVATGAHAMSIWHMLRTIRAAALT